MDVTAAAGPSDQLRHDVTGSHRRVDRRLTFSIAVVQYFGFSFHLSRGRQL